jgi:hypothetical protein
MRDVTDVTVVTHFQEEGKATGRGRFKVVSAKSFKPGRFAGKTVSVKNSTVFRLVKETINS